MVVNMIFHFLNDETGYAEWISKVGGFVYNNFGGHIVDFKTLHKSRCPKLWIGKQGCKRTSIEKICSENKDELISWLERNGMEYCLCDCSSTGDQMSDAANSNDSTEVEVALQREKVKDTLIAYGKTLKPQKDERGGTFTGGNKDADKFLRDDPFAFLIAACIDRGAKAETIWTVPYLLAQKLGHLDPNFFMNSKIEDIENVLRSLSKKPRYLGQAAKTMISLATAVVKQFNGDAASLWKNRHPREILNSLMQIWGVGAGIAHMTLRILIDEFDYDPGVEGYKQIDVKPDIQVRKVFIRSGLVNRDDGELCVEVARQICPEYPALLDWPTWEIGRGYCDQTAPRCKACPLDLVCLHRIAK